MAETIKQLTLRLPPALYDALRDSAANSEQSMTRLIIAVLAKWADKQKG